MDSKVTKITIINTMFVETDAVNFRSVVQKLTGKEPSEANREKAMPIKPQARGAVPPTAQSREEVCNANGGLEFEAQYANDAVDEVISLMEELGPHLGELYELMNE